MTRKGVSFLLIDDTYFSKGMNIYPVFGKYSQWFAMDDRQITHPVTYNAPYPINHLENSESTGQKSKLNFQIKKGAFAKAGTPVYFMTDGISRFWIEIDNHQLTLTRKGNSFNDDRSKLWLVKQSANVKIT